MRKFLCLLLISLLLLGCSNKKAETKAETKDNNATQSVAKLKVTTTTPFLEEMVNILAGDIVDLDNIIPIGEDPHLYELTPKDSSKLTEADIVFAHGLHFEGHMADKLEAINAVLVSKDFDKADIKEFEEDGKIEDDPHFWFDVKLYKQATTTLANSLIEKLPDHKETITKRLNDYLAKVDNMRKEAFELISAIPKENRYLVSPHDAFSYFAKEYDIETVAPQGITTEAEVSTADIIDTVKFIVDHKIKAIFTESTTNPDRILKLKEEANKLGHEVKVLSGEGFELLSDSLAPKGQKGDNYIDMVLHNARLISENLK